jgi:hypothetical protein
MKPLSLLFALLLLLALPALAGDLEKEPGYIDLEWIDIPDDAEEIQDIDLGPALLSAAADAEKSGDEELAKAFGMIRSIRVVSFSMDEALETVDEAVEKIGKDLKKKGWKRLIYVKDDDEIVTVSTRSVDDEMVGLMVVAHEPGVEASFVNVVGDLDLAYLMKMASRLHGKSLDHFLDELEDQGIQIHEHDHDGDHD